MQKSCQLKLAKVNSCNLCPDFRHSQDICKFTSHVLYFSYPILKPKYKVAHNVKNYLRELIFVTLAHSHWGETAEVCTKCTSFVKIFCYTHRSCFEKKIWQTLHFTLNLGIKLQVVTTIGCSSCLIEAGTQWTRQGGFWESSSLNQMVKWWGEVSILLPDFGRNELRVDIWTNTTIGQ